MRRCAGAGGGGGAGGGAGVVAVCVVADGRSATAHRLAAAADFISGMQVVGQF